MVVRFPFTPTRRLLLNIMTLHCPFSTRKKEKKNCFLLNMNCLWFQNVEKLQKKIMTIIMRMKFLSPLMKHNSVLYILHKICNSHWCRVTLTAVLSSESTWLSTVWIKGVSTWKKEKEEHDAFMNGPNVKMLNSFMNCLTFTENLCPGKKIK